MILRFSNYIIINNNFIYTITVLMKGVRKKSDGPLDQVPNPQLHQAHGVMATEYTKVIAVGSLSLRKYINAHVMEAF